MKKQNDRSSSLMFTVGKKGEVHPFLKGKVKKTHPLEARPKLISTLMSVFSNIVRKQVLPFLKRITFRLMWCQWYL